MEELERKLLRDQLDLPPFERVFAPLNAGWETASHPLAQWLAANFNHNFDRYDAAVDAVYNSLHTGGSQYHHLLDGQHSFMGALRSVRDVQPDDGLAREVIEASEHLLRDTASVSGINPLFSLSSEQFDCLARLGQRVGISRPFLADALTFNGPELIGGVVAIAVGLMLARDPDPGRLSALSGACLTSAAAAANPILLPAAAGGLVYALRRSEDKKRVLVQAGKGSLVSGSAMFAGGLVGGPVWLGIAASVGTAVAVQYALDNPERAFDRLQQFVRQGQGWLRQAALAYR